MLQAGVGAEAAMAWLERCREAGFRSRFTVPSSKVREVLEELARGPLGADG